MGGTEMDRIQFFRIRTGLGLKIFIVCSSLVLSFEALLKKSMLSSDELFKFALLLLITCPATQNTHSLAVLVVITQNVFLARSLRAGNYYLWSRHHWRMLLQLCIASSL